ncbi:MAG TPA: alkaline phosphatase family protein [Cytophagaceae bacterium]|jgi:hypothetical protein|nr:alkaline phosphatase family protein [Cytophagaceae bacterium]
MKKRNNFLRLSMLFLFLSTWTVPGLIAQDTSALRKYRTKRVVILVIDGPRFTETWGDTTYKYIPHQSNEIAESGVLCTDFYNDGFTYTTSGHAAICTGVRQELENSKGSDLPQQPSIFQYYLKKSGVPSTKAWVITSKDKLFILGNCNDPAWKGKYMPSIDCGINGQGSGYRNDSITFLKTMSVLKNQQPNLLLVNFKEPDGAGHANDWNGYLKGIKDTDSLVWEIWKFLQSDPYYKDQTALFITNDHGRHTEGVKDGFVNHGDDCDGCRHISLLACGPDFRHNVVYDKRSVQVDIPATVGELMGFSMPDCQGKVIKKLFKESHVK